MHYSLAVSQCLRYQYLSNPHHFRVCYYTSTLAVRLIEGWVSLMSWSGHLLMTSPLQRDHITAFVYISCTIWNLELYSLAFSHYLIASFLPCRHKRTRCNVEDGIARVEEDEGILIWCLGNSNDKFFRNAFISVGNFWTNQAKWR